MLLYPLNPINQSINHNQSVNQFIKQCCNYGSQRPAAEAMKCRPPMEFLWGRRAHKMLCNEATNALESWQPKQQHFDALGHFGSFNKLYHTRFCIRHS